MLLLQNVAIDECLKILITVTCAAFAVFTALMTAHRIFIRKMKRDVLKNQVSVSKKFYMKKSKRDTQKTEIVHTTLKSMCVVFALIFTLSAVDFTFVYASFAKAKSHAMVKDPDTKTYSLTLGQMRDYNRRSLKETDIGIDNLDSLKGKIIIIYRYDCSDCLELYDDLKDLENVIYLSSRTEKCAAFRDFFNPSLLKVPSGIYIRKDGKPVTLELYYSDGDVQKVMFDKDNWNRLLNIQKQDLGLSSDS
jgi:hypothetical protein